MSVVTAPSEPTHELGGTRFTSLATPSRGSTQTSVWQVEITPGTPATPHRLTREEVFVVLDGHASIRLDGEPGEAAPGDAIVVPPGIEFAITATGPGPLRALCSMPTDGQARIGDGEPFTPPWAL